ncbi:MAG: TRAP transporter small permease subunit [Chlorobiota bacterium]
MERLVQAVERVLRGAESVAALCVLVLTLLVFGNVLARYVFNVSAMALQELQWYFYALTFLLAMAPTLRIGGHVRIDVLYARFPEVWQRRIDIFGTLLLLLPFTGVVLWASYDFVAYSFAIREASPNPGGLPAVYVFKAAIPLSFGLLATAALALVWRRARGQDHAAAKEQRL